MPKRRYTRKSRTTKRRTFKKRRAVFQKRVSNAVVKMAEHKYLQNTVSSAVITTAAPMLTSINPMTVGSSRNNRLGNVIMMTGFKFNVVMQGNVGAVPYRYRVLIWLDRQWNGNVGPIAPANLPDLFADPAPGNMYFSLLNRNTVGPRLRYKILYDKMLNLQVDGGLSDVNQLKTLRGYIRMKTRVQYNEGNLGTVGDINRNMLTLAVISNQGVNLGTAAVNFQMFFVDV